MTDYVLFCETGKLESKGFDMVDPEAEEAAKKAAAEAQSEETL